MLARTEDASFTAERQTFGSEYRGGVAALVAALEAENATLKRRVAVLQRQLEIEDIEGTWADYMVSLNLPRQQAEILHLLVEAKGRPVSRYTIEAAISGHDHVHDRTLKIVDVLICKLRKRLTPNSIETRHGVGWRLNPDWGLAQ